MDEFITKTYRISYLERRPFGGTGESLGVADFSIPNRSGLESPDGGDNSDLDFFWCRLGVKHMGPQQGRSLDPGSRRL